MLHRPLMCLLFPCLLWAQETVVNEATKVTVHSMQSSGRPMKTGLGFLYDENTVVCSYADVKGASQIQVHWDGMSTNANRFISFNESVDIAILASQEEIPVVTPLGSSSTLGQGDKVFYWTQHEERWELSSATVHEILDTGKGYNLILIESQNYSTRSSPLYNADGKIVGWLQGKRAIPIETIASFAERENGHLFVKDVQSVDPSWIYVKPRMVNTLETLAFSEMKTVSGPASFPFKVNLPAEWQPNVSDSSGKFHVRYERSGICFEIRAISLGEEDVPGFIAGMESLIFSDFLRTDLNPYSAENLSGFLARYEDNDPMNPYSLQAFYTSFSNNLYLLSISYPRKMEESMKPLVERILLSFRR